MFSVMKDAKLMKMPVLRRCHDNGRKTERCLLLSNIRREKMKDEETHEHFYVLNRILLKSGSHMVDAEYVCSDCGDTKTKEYPKYVNPPMFFKEFA